MGEPQRTMPPKSLYQILEIPTDASEREIKRAYHALAKRLHPDKAQTPEEAKRLEANMATISQAYNILKDPQRRAEYDATLKTNAAAVATATAPGAPSAARGAGDATEIRGLPSASARRSQIAAKALAKGLQLLQANEPRKALDFLEAALANNEQDAMVQAKVAEAMLLSGRSLTRAAEHAEKAIDLDPWNVEHRLTLARLYEAAGIKSRAIEAYRDVLKWDATNQLAMAKQKELGGGLAASAFGGLFGRLFRRGK
jgi:curved DNA-binding protein CbpA